MRIEILVDNEEPQIFPLNKPKIIIGSHESCDVFLPNGGISRKHLMIVTENDNYYLIDQGSTNGSYINEERLVPGRKVEFTSFFPVRLGDNVLITLLSDEDARNLGFTETTERSGTSPNVDTSGLSDATRTISLKDLQGAKTETLAKKRQETVVKRKSQVRGPTPVKVADKSRMLWVQIFSFGILATAIYYQVYIKEPEVVAVPPAAQKIEREKKILPPAPRFPVVDTSDFTAKEKFNDLRKGLSCITEIEKYLCVRFPKEPRVVIQVGTMLHLFLDGGDYYQRAKRMVPPYQLKKGDVPDPLKTKKYKEDLKFVAVMLFLRENLPNDLDYKLLKGNNLTFVIELTIEEGAKQYVPLVFVSESLEKLDKAIKGRDFDMVKNYGGDALYYLREYLRMY